MITMLPVREGGLVGGWFVGFGVEGVIGVDVGRG